MKKFFGKLENNNIIIDGEDLGHLAVLRCDKDEEILCFCGDEYEYRCKIQEITKKYAICLILDKKLCKKNPTKNIVLFQGLPKLDKLELITQKLTELGISRIVPFESDFTIAKKNINKIERLNKISKESCKQCGRSLPVIIEEPIKFNDIKEKLKDFDLILFANETNREITDINFNDKKNIAVIVGSEGGFSNREQEILLKDERITQIGLGERILRTETASIVLCGIVSYLTKN